MNVRLLTPVMGHAAGTYEVHSITDGTYTLKDEKGALFEVPASSLEQAAQTPAPPPESAPDYEVTHVGKAVENNQSGRLFEVFTATGEKLTICRDEYVRAAERQRHQGLPVQEILASIRMLDTPEPEAPPAALLVDDYTEEVARAMYDDYCAAVGGVAFNGDPLPPASEFFEDARKTKQANAWRATAFHAVERIANDTLKNVEEATGTDLRGEGMPNGIIGNQADADPEKDLIGEAAASSAGGSEDDEDGDYEYSDSVSLGEAQAESSSSGPSAGSDDI